MDMINWDNSFGVGIRAIDEQHMKLFSIMNKLIDASGNGKSFEIIGDILKQLEDYTNLHFKTEEKYFKEFHFEGEFEHKEEHKKFEKIIDDFKIKHKKKQPFISFELIEFLIKWMAQHIQNTDRKYIDCFKENGLS